jgi:hypothetical protein
MGANPGNSIRNQKGQLDEDTVGYRLSERPDLATDQKAGALSGALLRKAIAIEKKTIPFCNA